MTEKDFSIYFNKDTQLSSVDQHSHNYYELLVFISGHVDFFYDDEIFTLEPDMLLLIPPHVKHHLSVSNYDKDYVRYVLWFTEELLLDYSSNQTNLLELFDHKGSNFPFLKLPIDSRLHLRSTLQNILYNHRSKELGSELVVRSLITRLLVSLLKTKKYNNYNLESRNNSTDDTVNYIQEYVSNHVYEKIDINDLAEKLFISRTHLERIFNDKMGLSISHYITKKKIYLAQKDILQGDHFQLVSDRYSFGNYSTFYRVFKKEFRLSPSAYLKLSR